MTDSGIRSLLARLTRPETCPNYGSRVPDVTVSVVSHAIA